MRNKEDGIGYALINLVVEIKRGFSGRVSLGMNRLTANIMILLPLLLISELSNMVADRWQ